MPKSILNKRISFSLLPALFCIFVAITAYAQTTDYASDLAGKWADQDGREFVIRAEGPDIVVYKPHNPTGNTPPVQGNINREEQLADFVPIGTLTFSGGFNRDTTQLRHTVSSIDDFDYNLPASVRRQLVDQGYSISADITILSNNEIVFTQIVDEVAYTRLGQQVTGITPSRQIEYRLTRQSSYRIGRILNDTEAYRERMNAEHIPALEREFETLTEELGTARGTIDIIVQDIENKNEEIEQHREARRTIQTEIEGIYARIQNRFEEAIEEENRAALAEKIRQIQDHDRRGLDLDLEFMRLTDDLDDETQQKDRIEWRVAYKIRAIEKLRQEPVTSNIDIFSGDRHIYAATIDIDQEFLNELEDEARTVKSAINDFTVELSAINGEEETNNEESAELQQELNSLSQEVTEASDALADKIVETSQDRAFVEFGFNIIDVLMATADAGVIGAGVELIHKVGEAAILNGTYNGAPVAFNSYDESALREAYEAGLNEALEEQGLLSSNFADQQLVRSGLRAGNTLVTQKVFQGRELLRIADLQRARWEYNQLRSNAGRSMARESFDDALRRTAFSTTTQIEETREAMRRFIREKDELSRARRAVKDQLDRIRNFRNRFGQNIGNLDLRHNRLHSLGRSIGIDLALNSLKDSINNQINQEEQDAWLSYFEALALYEVRLKTYFKFIENRNLYRSIKEKYQQGKEAMTLYLEDMERIRQDYLNSYLESNGYFVETNESFDHRDRPLRLELTVIATAQSEPRTNSFLLSSDKSPSPRLEGELQDTESFLTRDMDVPLTDIDLWRAPYYYTHEIGIENLDTLQPDGNLPLLIEIE